MSSLEAQLQKLRKEADDMTRGLETNLVKEVFTIYRKQLIDLGVVAVDNKSIEQFQSDECLSKLPFISLLLEIEKNGLAKLDIDSFASQDRKMPVELVNKVKQTQKMVLDIRSFLGERIESLNSAFGELELIFKDTLNYSRAGEFLDFLIQRDFDGNPANFSRRAVLTSNYVRKVINGDIKQVRVSTIKDHILPYFDKVDGSKFVLVWLKENYPYIFNYLRGYYTGELEPGEDVMPSVYIKTCLQNKGDLFRLIESQFGKLQFKG